MFGTVIQLDPCKHRRIALPDIEGYLARETGESDRFFTYYHLDTLNWIVGLWANKAAGRFMEFKVIAENVPIGARPTVGPGKLEAIVRMWRAPENSQVWNRIMHGADRQFAKNQNEFHEDHLARGASLGSRRRLDQRSAWFDYLARRRRRRRVTGRPALVMRGY